MTPRGTHAWHSQRAIGSAEERASGRRGTVVFLLLERRLRVWWKRVLSRAAATTRGGLRRRVCDRRHAAGADNDGDCRGDAGSRLKGGNGLVDGSSLGQEGRWS